VAPAPDVGRRSDVRRRHEPSSGAATPPRRTREAGTFAVLGHMADLLAAEAARRLGAAGGHQVGGDRPAWAARKACIPPGTTLVDDREESIRIHQGIPAHLGWGSSDRRRPTRVRHKTARSTYRRGGSTTSFRQLAFSFRRRARRNPVKLLIFVLRIRRQTEANPLRGISFNMRRPSARGWGEGWRIRIEEPTRIRGRSIVGATCARRGRGRGTTHPLLGGGQQGSGACRSREGRRRACGGGRRSRVVTGGICFFG